jgi:hypothetical protein
MKLFKTNKEILTNNCTEQFNFELLGGTLHYAKYFAPNDANEQTPGVEMFSSVRYDNFLRL